MITLSTKEVEVSEYKMLGAFSTTNWPYYYTEDYHAGKQSWALARVNGPGAIKDRDEVRIINGYFESFMEIKEAKGVVYPFQTMVYHEKDSIWVIEKV